MSRLAAIFLFLFGFNLLVDAQSYLYLKKLGGANFMRYRLQDEIRFQLKGDDRFASGTITQFGENFFMIHETKIYLDSLYRIDIRNKSGLSRGMRGSSNPLITASILLPLADFVNNTVVSGEEADMPHRSVWIGSLALLGAGIGLKLLAPKYFELGPKRKAVIINADPVGIPGQDSPDRGQGDG